MRPLLYLCALLVPLTLVTGCDSNPQPAKTPGAQAGGNEEKPPLGRSTLKQGQRANP